MNELLDVGRVPVDPALDSYVRLLEALPAGPDLGMELAVFTEQYRTGPLNPHLQTRIAALWLKVATWAETEALTDIAAGAATADATGDPLQIANQITDLALTTSTGESWAARETDLAVDLATRLPAMADALRTATLTLPRARALARALDTTDDATALRIDDRVTPRAARNNWTPSQLAAAARRTLARIDPDGGADRHDNALDQHADVTGGPMADGLGWLAATGDTLTIAEILHTIDQHADTLQRTSPDTPPGRARFAALAELVLGPATTLLDHLMATTARQQAPTPDDSSSDGSGSGSDAGIDQPVKRARRRARREVIITIDLPTLLGLRDNPAEIVGYGPVPARIARLIATDATIRRLVTDPITGNPLDLDRRHRFPTDTLVTAIRATQHTCQFPRLHPPATTRPRPPHRLDPARPHQPRQPPTPLPQTPQPQNRRPLDTPPTPRRKHHLDRPRRANRHPPPRPP